MTHSKWSATAYTRRAALAWLGLFFVSAHAQPTGLLYDPEPPVDSGYVRVMVATDMPKVSVVVDDQVKVDAASGETTRVPWSSDDLARFTRLVQDSVGFDASRGDSVSVINTPFSAEVGEEIIEIPFYTQPWFWDVVKQVLGVLFILVLVFGVLRPVLNNITGNGKKQLALAGSDVELGGMGGLDGELANDRVSLGGPQSILLPSPSEGYDAQLNAIKSLVAEDPGRVAQVVKEWINADE